MAAAIMFWRFANCRVLGGLKDQGMARLRCQHLRCQLYASKNASSAFNTETVEAKQRKAALQKALEMKRQGKRDALTELYGSILEEEKDSLFISPFHERALMSRERPLPTVEGIDQRHFGIIDSKVRRLLSIPKGNSALRREMEENHYQHVYHTVAIEGSTLTLEEVRSIIETRYAVPGKSLKEQNEAIGVDEAIKYIKSTLLSRAGDILLTDILEIHRRLLGYADPVEAGRLRKVQVYVGRHVPPHSRDVDRRMQELLQWLNGEEAQKLHPVELAALAHYKLAYIHPFADGNGRTSRLLMNLLLMQAGYPPSVIRVEQSAEYFRALDTADRGDVQPFISFLARCIEDTLDTFLFFTNEH